MPASPKSEIDWGKAKQEWGRGVLSRAEIARVAGDVTRQALNERAEREGWVYGGESEVQKVEQDRPTLKQCKALVTQYSHRVERLGVKSEDQIRQMKVTPENLGQALHAAYQGAKGTMMANAAGLDEGTLRTVLREDEGMGRLVRHAHASHALRSLRFLDKAQERGDSASARFLLEKGAYSSEYGTNVGAGNMQLQVVLNINDPTPPGTTIDMQAMHEPDTIDQ